MAEEKALTPEKKEIVNLLEENIKSGAGMWRKNWFSQGAPLNASTRKPYRGVNNVYLTLLAMKRGYSDNRWATYNQMKKEGWKFKDNPEGWAGISREAATIEFFELKDKATGKVVDKSKLKDMTTAERKLYFDSGIKCAKKTYKVYNVELMEGPEKLELPENGRSERAEKMIEYWSKNEAKIVFGGQDSYYHPPTDTIFVPERESFIDYGGFYNTVFHEMAHSTGAPNRLSRRFYPTGTYGYALEEMRAEIASLFIAQQFDVNITQSSAKNSSAYLENWMEALTDDPNCFFDAVYEAQDIAKYIAEKEPEADKMVETEVVVPALQDMDAMQNLSIFMMSDDEILKKAQSGRGGEKFNALYKGKQIWADSEKNDEMFFKRLSLYTEDADQLARIYKNSARKKQSDEYLSEKIDNAISETETEIERQENRLKGAGRGAQDIIETIVNKNDKGGM